MSVPPISLYRVLHPYAAEREDCLRSKGRHFVHYSTADTAYKILTNREMWMRNASVMNDFSEVQYGLDCLDRATREGLQEKLNGVLNQVHPELADRVQRLFSAWKPLLRHTTFLTCLSEHLGVEHSEDTLGRLSMWRAYGGDSGVALVLKRDILDNVTIPDLSTSAVLYEDHLGFCQQFARVVESLSGNLDMARKIDPATLAVSVFDVLRFATLCTKHPGFREELEWRVIYTPNRASDTAKLPRCVQTIRGIPQTVYKIKLDNPDSGLHLRDILHSVIIGPTQYPMVLRETFYRALLELGFPDPNLHITQSDIPLRR